MLLFAVYGNSPLCLAQLYINALYLVFFLVFSSMINQSYVNECGIYGLKGTVFGLLFLSATSSVKPIARFMMIMMRQIICLMSNMCMEIELISCYIAARNPKMKFNLRFFIE